MRKIIIGGKEDPYLIRFQVLPKNKYFNIYIHKFMRDDDARAFHDHPWSSLSFILKGSYIEVTKAGRRIFERFSFIYRPAKMAHRLELLQDLSGKKIPTWTILFVGPRTRLWGFHCEKGWVPWINYVNLDDPLKTGIGCEGEAEDMIEANKKYKNYVGNY